MPLTGQTAPKVLASCLLGVKDNCRGNVEELHTEDDGEATEKRRNMAKCCLGGINTRW